MNRKTLRETIGFIGIVGSLVFVGLEIRGNTLAARAAAYQHMGTAISTVWMESAQDPDRALRMMRSFEGPMGEMTPQDSAQMAAQSIAALRQYEVIWRQVELGLLDREALTYFGFAPGGIANRPFWPRVRGIMSPDFRAFIETAASP